MGCVHDECLELADGLGAAHDGALASGHQYPQCFAVAASAGLRQVLPAERLTGRTNRVQVVGLCTVASRRSGGAVDLDDPFARFQQRRGQAGAVTAGSFDGPHAAAVSMLVGERLQASVSECIGGNGQLVDDPASGRVHDRGRMGVAMGVDADDELDGACQYWFHFMVLPFQEECPTGRHRPG